MMDSRAHPIGSQLARNDLVDAERRAGGRSGQAAASYARSRPPQAVPSLSWAASGTVEARASGRNAHHLAG